MIRLIDTSPAFEEFAAAVALESPLTREQMWGEKYEAASPEIFEAFGTRSASRRPPSMLRELARVRNQARAGAAALNQVLEGVETAVRTVLDLPPEPAPIHVLLVGDGSVNATVGRLGGEVAVFHCLEWFRTPAGASVLAAHEDTHAWHEIMLGVSPPENDLAWVTFSEGLATVVSKAAVPGQSDADYFWYGHPGFDGWMSWCQENRERLRAAVVDRLDDDSATETFFGAGDVDGRPRVGYFVAADLVTSLGRPLPELLRLSVDEAKAVMRAQFRPS